MFTCFRRSVLVVLVLCDCLLFFTLFGVAFPVLDVTKKAEEEAEEEEENLVETIPDRFFKLPSEIEFADSHMVQKSRYFLRLKQHQVGFT